jgi:hypothetical protein
MGALFVEAVRNTVAMIAAMAIALHRAGEL